MGANEPVLNVGYNLATVAVKAVGKSGSCLQNVSPLSITSASGILIRNASPNMQADRLTAKVKEREMKDEDTFL